MHSERGSATTASPHYCRMSQDNEAVFELLSALSSISRQLHARELQLSEGSSGETENQRFSRDFGHRLATWGDRLR